MKDPLYQKYHREHAEEPSLDLPLINRLLKYLRPYRWLVLIAILLLLIARGIEALVPVYIGHVTQQIIDGTALDEMGKESLFSTVLENCLLILAILTFSYLLDTASILLKSWVGQKALLTLRTQLYEHVERLPLAYYDRHAVGRLMTRTIHDVDQISQMFTESVVPIIGNLLLFIGMCIGIAYIDWQIALLFALIVPVVIKLTNRFRHYQRYCYEMIRNIVSAMNSFVQEYLMGASTIRTFGLQKQEKRKFDEMNTDLCQANLETIHHFASFIASIDFLQSLSLILVFVTLVLFAPPGTGFQVGTYFTFSLYALMFFRPLTDLAERYNVLQAAIAAADRIFTILDHPTEPSEEIREPSLKEMSTISFENVWFAYEPENWILKGVSFTVNLGESIALVGITGAGKTTIMNLLLRFYDFQKGSIKIDGRDIREYPLYALRRQFSVVLQDPVIFSGTLMDNIGLYQPAIGADRIEQVIDYVNLRPLVDRFPDGIRHQLSERGKSLSAGEMQLIALARAVAHERDVLILDEATANIDLITEKSIQDALKKVLKNKTALVIAHRLSTIKDVTRIIVLHEGKVAETGTHQELISQKGLYEKLYRLQFIMQ